MKPDECTHLSLLNILCALFRPAIVTMKLECPTPKLVYQKTTKDNEFPGQKKQ